MKILPARCCIIAAIVSATLTFCSPVFGQDTSDVLVKALDFVHQVESPSGNPQTDAQRIDLLTQAITMAQEAPDHRLMGHRVLAIQAIGGGEKTIS